MNESLLTMFVVMDVTLLSFHLIERVIEKSSMKPDLFFLSKSHLLFSPWSSIFPNQPFKAEQENPILDQFGWGKELELRIVLQFAANHFNLKHLARQLTPDWWQDSNFNHAGFSVEMTQAIGLLISLTH